MSGAYIPRSKSDKWQTPSDLYDKLNQEFQFNFDPCPIDWDESKPDGLVIEWGTSTFCNPPYSRCAEFIEKAHIEWQKGNKTIVLLINAITDTKAFHRFIKGNAEIRFIEGRLKFVNPNEPDKRQPNVRPSILCIFRPSG